MSSFVRRVQKGIAKSMGYYRYKDGYIYNTDGACSRRWPQVAAPTKGKSVVTAS